MALVILNIDGTTARELESWNWDTLIEPDVGSVEVNAFDTAEELAEAVATWSSQR